MKSLCDCILSDNIRSYSIPRWLVLVDALSVELFASFLHDFLVIGHQCPKFLAFKFLFKKAASIALKSTYWHSGMCMNRVPTLMCRS